MNEAAQRASTPSASVRTGCLLVLAAASLAGCGTASMRSENWTYIGADAALRSPPTMRNGDSSDAAWRLEAQQTMSAWQKKLSEASNAAKSACSSETGDSATPDLLRGYASPFLTCMKLRGWMRGFNDPL